VGSSAADGSKEIAVAARSISTSASVPIDNGHSPLGGIPTKVSESESSSSSASAGVNTKKRSLAQSTAQSTTTSASQHSHQATEHLPTKSEIKMLERGLRVLDI